MSDAPKISHVIYRLAMGGMENGLVNLVNRMDDRITHQIISLTDITDFKSRITNNNVELVALNKKPGKDLGVYWRLFKQLRAFKPNIVHTRNFGTVDCGVIAKLALTRFWIHSEHGWDMGDLDGSNSRYLKLRRLLSPLASKYLAVSKDIKRWLEAEVKIPARKLSHIYNGVDAEKFKTEQPRERESLTIGFVGRIEAVKNPLSLVKAFRRIQNETDLARNVRLRIVGSGSLHDELQAQIQAWNLHDVVEMPGARSDIAGEMRNFDVFVLPSFNEGISNTILEAMASGLPVVACEVGGNPELVKDGYNGVLYESDDDQALATALKAYINNEELRAQHGKASRQRIDEKFTLNKMISNYEQMYFDCLKGN